MEATALYTYEATADDELSFQKGQVVNVLDIDNDDQWLNAEISGKKGVVPSNYVKLKPHSWFVGKLSRQDAEAKLETQVDGSFVIRPSQMEPGGFSLSVKFESRVQHFRVLKNSESKYFLWEKKFDSLNELIKYHRDASVSRTQFITLKGHHDKNFPRVKAMHNFEPQQADELALRRGDIIIVTDKSEDDWWSGEINGKSGVFPKNYVQLID